MTGRAYTDAERAEAVGLALSLGDADEAAKRTGVSRRTISRWIAEVRTGEGPTARIIPAGTREQVAGVLWEAVETGASEVVRRMVDPGARLGDVASALRVSIEAHALLTGGATARTESFNVNAEVEARALRGFTEEDKRALMKFIQEVNGMTDDELRAEAPNILPAIAEGLKKGAEEDERARREGYSDG